MVGSHCTFSRNMRDDPDRKPHAVQTGQLYNAEDGRKALRDIFSLGLFDNVQVWRRHLQCLAAQNTLRLCGM